MLNYVHCTLMFKEELSKAIHCPPTHLLLLRNRKESERKSLSVQYADNLTVFVPNIECAKHVFQLLNVFRSCSGLKVNYTKTKVIWIGSSRDAQFHPWV